MRAVRLYEYGDASVLRLEEVEPTALGPHDLRIAVKASSVNPVDAKIRSGAQRAIVWLTMPWTLGMDVSGVVREVGEKVTGFSVGDEVFSSPSHRRMGCYAEEVVVRAAEVAHKPKSISHQEAASLPLVALTAWDALDAVKLRAGQRILIQAGSGGVGTIAIQLAKLRGAEVLTTSSAKNHDLVKGLGADRAIDYHEESFEEVAAGCDAVLESIGGDHIDRAIATVRRGGHVASITPGLPTYAKRYGAYLGFLVFAVRIAATLVRARVTRGVRLHLVTRKTKGENLAAIAKLVEEGKLRPVVDRVFPLDEIVEAHRYLETGRARGKVVISVRH